MIDKSWFNLEKCRIVDEDLEEGGIQDIKIVRKNRTFQLYMCEYEENPVMNTDIFLSENNTTLACYRYSVPLSKKNNIPIEEIKFIFEEWLLNRSQLEKLKLKFSELEIFEDYQYYSQGKEVFEQYKLDQVRDRLYSPNRDELIAVVKLFDLYRKSKILKSLFPYTSMGRLHLSLDEKGSDYCSFGYWEERFYVSMCREKEKNYHFDSAEETIAFLENKFQNL